MRVALVTGGSRGLGEAVVKTLRTAGWRVLELSRSGHGEDHFTVDMSDPLSAVEIFQEILQSIDADTLEEVLFVSNAGVLTPVSKVPGMTVEEMLHSFNVNINSALTMIHTFINAFRSFTGKKSVVSVSSGAAVKGYPGWSLYCAGKAACENYMRTLFMEEALEREPFQVISFNPGVMDTEMQAEIRRAQKSQFPMQERFLNLKKEGKLRSPRAVAEKLISIVERDYSQDQFLY